LRFGAGVLLHPWKPGAGDHGLPRRSYVSRWEQRSTDTRYFHASWTSADPIDGYQYAIHRPSADRHPADRRRDNDLICQVLQYADRAPDCRARIPLQPVLERAAAYRGAGGARGRRDEVPITLLRAEASGPHGAALLYLTVLNAARGDSGWSVTSLDGELFLRLN
jgi:hypothetical protein